MCPQCTPAMKPLGFYDNTTQLGEATKFLIWCMLDTNLTFNMNGVNIERRGSHVMTKIEKLDDEADRE